MATKKSSFRAMKILPISAAVNLVCFGINAANAAITLNNSLTLDTATKTEDGKFVNADGEEVSNVITEYVIEDDRIIPQYYSATLSKTEYGEGSDKLQFSWQDDGGLIKLNIVDDNGDLVFKYNNTNTSDRLINPSGDINLNFINNELSSPSSSDSIYGAAIYNKDNSSAIAITGDFVGNKLDAKQDGHGASIYNENSTIKEISGNFVNNSISSTGFNGRGAAIFNGSEDKENQGSAIISEINASFIGNKITTSSFQAAGAAIYNATNLTTTSTIKGSQIGNITGDFIGNGVSTSGGKALGGAITNGEIQGNGIIGGFSIGDITGNFIGNYAISSSSMARGGAIYNDYGSIGNIAGDFIGNYTFGVGSNSGGAIYNSNNKAVISSITGDFIGNYVESSDKNGLSVSGGAIYNYSSAQIHSIKGDFIGNYVKDNTSSFNTKAIYATYGGAIYNTGTIDTIEGNFYNNSAVTSKSSTTNTHTAKGGAVYNGYNATINNLKGGFVNNYVSAKTSQGGAIYNYGVISINDAVFANNYATSSFASGAANGGAIYNYNGTINLTNASFIDNYVEVTGTSSTASGGAIYAATDLTITTESGGTSLFRGNKAIVRGQENSDSIYLDKASAILNLSATEDGSIIFDDVITAKSGGSIVISGDETGRVEFNNAVKGFSKVTSSDVTVAFGSSDYGSADLTGAAFNITSGGIDMQNGTIQEVYMDSFTAGNDVKISFDADMENGKADKIITANGASGNLTIGLGAINILQDMTKEGDTILTIFEDTGGNNTISFTNISENAAFSKYYKYTFENGETAGTLNVTATDNMFALNGAVDEDRENDKSYSIDGSGGDVVRDLGKLDGDSLTIFGNGNNLDGEGFGGMITADGQAVEVNDVESVTGFDSANDGGFIKNSGTLTVENSSFENNHSDGNGGAIWSNGTVNIVASDDKDHKFSGNTSAGGYNAIYMEGGELNLQVSSGSLTFDDTIDGTDYTLNIGGGSTGNINFNNTVSGADEINIKGGNVNLAQDNLFDDNAVNLDGGILSLENGSLGVASFAELNGGNGELHFEVNTVALTSDLIKVGSINGEINVVAVNIGGYDTDAVANRDDNEIKFAEVSEASSGSFNIFRVEKSAYMWDTYSRSGENGATDWLMNVKKENTPDDPNNPNNPDTPIVVPEVTAYLGLHTAGVEQTRDMLRNVEEKSFSGRYRVPLQNGYCNSPACYLYNVWVAPIYSSSRVKSPVNMDADVKGLEFGGDIQQDKRNRIGLFASLRQGDYDLDGTGDYYISTIASKIDMDSYILGAYYRYVNNNWWFISDIYGGMLKADIKTNDGVNASSDGYQFGGAATLGYDFWMQKDLTLSPLVRLGYMMQRWDDVKDNYGKTSEYDTLSMFELELGAKLQKVWGNAYNQAVFNAWIMPSIVQTVVSGSDVTITDLQKVKTVDNGTLGRIAGGINYYFAKSWNIYGSASYTFGSDYNNKEILLGINYSF